jgi:hypothetical protein
LRDKLQAIRLQNKFPSSILVSISILLLGAGPAPPCMAQQPPDSSPSRVASPERTLVVRYCVECHNSDEQTAGLALDAIINGDVTRHTAEWERVYRKLLARQMPPIGVERPSERAYDAVLASLEASLDREAAHRPDPGRTETLRRLSRVEYQNAIRDLLALEIDAASLLPADESSHGFDIAAGGDLSPTLLERYISAAERISRTAVGSSYRDPVSDTFRVRPDLTQEQHVPGLPIGTRGGTLIPYHFPQDGDYEVQIRLTRDRNEEVEGLTEPHELELLLDRQRVGLFTVEPPPGRKNFETVDEKLKTRIKVAAGPHQLGVTFLKNSDSLLETRRQPYQAHFNMHRHPRISPAIYQVTITGPMHSTRAGDTPSRRRIFVCDPADASEEQECATRIIATFMRRAYRRPVLDADLNKPIQLYREAHAQGGFEAGIEMALSAVLVSPHFLFRIERDPAGIAPRAPYAVSDLELASRLSFFLWSSIPDDELLDVAERGELREPGVLEDQVRRMLADDRSQSLATNFAAQWLQLRVLESMTPDQRLFPDFDHNLRQAFRQETELLFEHVMREDRSVLDLLQSDYTFLNERLARHYGVPHVYDSRFRLVPLGVGHERGGLLRHGSILTATSYATRTSPVLRGKWVLENLLGTPPPPPPANVPALKDNTVSSSLSVRERLSAHRVDAACASCHNLIDPVGFALESFDAVGRHRTFEEGKPVDDAGGLPDGSSFDGVAGLEEALLNRPQVFVTTLVEKLLVFALGRGVGEFDAPAIRKILRDSSADSYRFSTLIMGIASSTPFQMRRSE